MQFSLEVISLYAFWISIEWKPNAHTHTHTNTLAKLIKYIEGGPNPVQFKSIEIRLHCSLYKAIKALCRSKDEG